MDALLELGYIGLFLSAFIAATLFPMGSELVLISLIATGADPLTSVFIAGTGNVLGSLVNYALGYWLGPQVATRVLRIQRSQFEQAQKRFQRLGTWGLCLAWLPIVGDPLTLVAGVLKVRLGVFILLVSAGKFARYAILAYLTSLS